MRHLPGDFFSVEETREGLVLALGDIGGKGLAAGMWVTHLIGLIRTHTAANSDPEAIVEGVNRDIARLSSVEPLSTMFVARLDSRSGLLDYCSAGHPPALHLRANGQLELLSEGGPVLGAVRDGVVRSRHCADGPATICCWFVLMVFWNHSTKRNRSSARCGSKPNCVAHKAARLSLCCFQCWGRFRTSRRHDHSQTT